MKLWNIIRKNFKILLRSRSSAFVVIVGPLLIITLISLALSNSQDYSINVGVVAPGEGELTQDFLGQLKNDGYSISEYEKIEECIKQIHQGNSNICLQLPEDFVIEDDKVNTIEFHVDQSRINLVESVIASVSSTIGVRSEEITLSLTQGLVDTVDAASKQIEKENGAIKEIKLNVGSIDSKSEEIKYKGQESGLDDASESLSAAKSKVEQINKSSQKLGTESEDILKDINCGDDSSCSDLVDELQELSKKETTNISNATFTLDKTLNSLDEKLSAANENIAAITENADALKDNTGKIELKISEIETAMQATKSKIDGLQITTAASIVNPVEISVNPILSSTDRSILMFPYFLTLIILFVGIMLSSTLVVMEKKSRAFFKTFTTPTSGMYHLTGGYLTNIVILFSQLAAILTASFYYLKVALLDNILVTLAILALSVTFFVLLGTLIGYVFRSQEGTTIASISVGTLFLFLSNVVLPVESFPTILRKIVASTPYMLSAELIKESVLFNVGFRDLGKELVLLGSYVVIVAVLVLVFHKLSSARFFEGSADRRTLRKPHVTKDNSFRFTDGSIARNKKELLSALKIISDDDFHNYVDGKNNEIALWLKDTFKDKKTARKVKKARSREETAAVLSADVQEAQPRKGLQENWKKETEEGKKTWLPRVRFAWGREEERKQEEEKEGMKIQRPVKSKNISAPVKNKKAGRPVGKAKAKMKDRKQPLKDDQTAVKQEGQANVQNTGAGDDREKLREVNSDFWKDPNL